MAPLTPHHDRHKLIRLGIAAALGAVAGVLIPTPDHLVVTRILIGFILASLAFALPLLRTVMRASVEDTRSYVQGLAPGRSVTDLVVTFGSLGALAGVGIMLAAKSGEDAGKIFEAGLTVLSVASGWLLVHLMFGLRYARHWFNVEPGCIDFHMDEAPAYSDFVYMAYAVGVSFAITDTDLRTTAVRRIALRHAWVSYLFGTVIVAATINLIAGLAK